MIGERLGRVEQLLERLVGVAGRCEKERAEMGVKMGGTKEAAGQEMHTPDTLAAVDIAGSGNGSGSGSGSGNGENGFEDAPRGSLLPILSMFDNPVVSECSVVYFHVLTEVLS